LGVVTLGFADGGFVCIPQFLIIHTNDDPWPSFYIRSLLCSMQSTSVQSYKAFLAIKAIIIGNQNILTMLNVNVNIK
jgi:hypothetical protein